MGRGIAFTHSEDEYLVANAENKTARELFDVHQELRHDLMWTERSVKSIARRVERLREEGKLGTRDDETRRKAYYGRHKPRSD